MEKKQMKTRITGLLALTLAFMLLFSNSLPVFAAEYDDYALSVGTMLNGGDRIMSCTSAGVYVYIDGTKVFNSSQNYTVPAGTYQVSNITNDRSIYIYLTTGSGAGAATPHVHIWEVKEVLQAADADTDAHGAWACACGATKNEAIPNTGFATFLEDSCDEILNAEENSTVEIDTGIWGALRYDVIEAIKEREDLTVKITLTYENEKYLLVFGPNRDMSVLEEADWYGVLYLSQFFGVEQEADAE